MSVAPLRCRRQRSDFTLQQLGLRLIDPRDAAQRMTGVKILPPIRVPDIEVAADKDRRVWHQRVGDQERHKKRGGPAERVQPRLRLEAAQDAQHSADPPDDFDGKNRAARGRARPKGVQRRGGRQPRRAKLDARRHDIGDDRKHEQRRKRRGAGGGTHEKRRDRKLKREPSDGRIEAIGIKMRRPGRRRHIAARRGRRRAKPSNPRASAVRQAAARASSARSQLAPQA